jgi:hypothetical protein
MSELNFSKRAREGAAKAIEAYAADAVERQNREASMTDAQRRYRLLSKNLNLAVESAGNNDELADSYADVYESEFYKLHFPNLPRVEINSRMGNVLSPTREPLHGVARLNRIREIILDPRKLINQDDADMLRMFNEGDYDNAVFKGRELGYIENVDENAMRREYQERFNARSGNASAAQARHDGGTDFAPVMDATTGAFHSTSSNTYEDEVARRNYQMADQQVVNKRIEQREQLRSIVYQRNFLNIWAAMAPSMYPIEHELVRRALERGQFGLAGTEQAGGWHALYDLVNVPGKIKYAFSDADDIIAASQNSDYNALAQYSDAALYWTYTNHYAKYDKRAKTRMCLLLDAARGKIIEDTGLFYDVTHALTSGTNDVLRGAGEFAVGTAALGLEVGGRTLAWDWDKNSDGWYTKMSKEMQQQADMQATLGASTGTLGYSEGGFIAEATTGVARQIPLWATIALGSNPYLKLSKPVAPATTAQKTAEGAKKLTRAQKFKKAVTPALEASKDFGRNLVTMPRGEYIMMASYAGDTMNEIMAQGAPLHVALGYGAISAYGEGLVEKMQWGTIKSPLKLTAGQLRKAKAAGVKAFSEYLAKTAAIGTARAGWDITTEQLEEGLQASIVAFAEAAALDKDGINAIREIKDAFVEEYSASLPTMVGAVVGGRGLRSVHTAATMMGQSDALLLGQMMKTGPFDGMQVESDAAKELASKDTIPSRRDARMAEIMEGWRTQSSDAERLEYLKSSATGFSATEAEAMHRYLDAVDKIQTRHKGAFLDAQYQYYVLGNQSYRDLADPSISSRLLAENTVEGVERMFKGMGFTDVSVNKASDKEGAPLIVALKGKNGVGLSFVVSAKDGFATFGSAGEAHSVYNRILNELFAGDIEAFSKQYESETAFIERWRQDAEFRKDILARHKMYSPGEFSKADAEIEVKTPSGDSLKLSIKGVLELAYGYADNRTLAHETLHAFASVVREIIQNAPDQESEIVQWAKGMEAEFKQVVKDYAELTGYKPTLKKGESFDEELVGDLILRGTSMGFAKMDAEEGRAMKRKYDQSIFNVKRWMRAFVDFLYGTNENTIVRDGEIIENFDAETASAEIAHMASLGQNLQVFNQLYANMSNADVAQQASETAERVRKGSNVNRDAVKRIRGKLRIERDQLLQGEQSEAVKKRVDALNAAIKDYEETDRIALERAAIAINKQDAEISDMQDVETIREYNEMLIERNYQKALAAAATDEAKEAAAATRDEALAALAERVKTLEAQVQANPKTETPAEQNEQADDTRYSFVTAEQDLAYKRAVEEGDLDLARQMVREAAAKAMPNTKVVDDDGLPLVVYHGTANGGAFTAFDVKKLSGSTLSSQKGAGFYFTNVKSGAQEYLVNMDPITGRISNGRDPHLFEVFLDIHNPIMDTQDLDKESVKKLYLNADEWFIKTWIPSSLYSIWNPSKNVFNGVQYNSKEELAALPHETLVSLYLEKNKHRETADILQDLVRAYGSSKQDKLLEAMRDILGADGVIAKGVRGLNQYIAWSPAQIKSADVATYDDNGNLIPLSQRFNPYNDDTRFSISSIYTGSAADYAQRLEDGTIVNGPSLHYVGTGEGAQVYGWGLYGSTSRGVAEWYARKDAKEKGRPHAFQNYRVYKNGKLISELKDKTLTISLYEEFGTDEAVRDAIDKRDLLPFERQMALQEIGTYTIAPVTDAEKKIRENLYEQTFFTDRPEGDESHLLDWDGEVTDEQRQWVMAQLDKEFTFGEGEEWLREVLDESKTGEQFYLALQDVLVEKLGLDPNREAPKAASEFLARAGIDGVTYIGFDSGVRNYVSFRDDNIRVDHKWVDGKRRDSAAAEQAQREYDEVVARYKGTDQWLKAPNGKPTNLTELQWVQVRTPSFKKWFGDWENDPANASKVVDENGEPLVVYHGTDEWDPLSDETENGFDTIQRGRHRENTGAWFTASYNQANMFGGNVVGCFLNIRNPYEIDADGASYEEIPSGYEARVFRNGVLVKDLKGEEWKHQFETKALAEEDAKKRLNDIEKVKDLLFYPSDTIEVRVVPSLKHVDDAVRDGRYLNHDGAIINDIVDGDVGRGDYYIAFSPSQIKSATDNIGTFDDANPDIRYSISGINMGNGYGNGMSINASHAYARGLLTALDISETSGIPAWVIDLMPYAEGHHVDGALGEPTWAGFYYPSIVDNPLVKFAASVAKKDDSPEMRERLRKAIRLLNGGFVAYRDADKLRAEYRSELLNTEEIANLRKAYDDEYHRVRNTERKEVIARRHELGDKMTTRRKEVGYPQYKNDAQLQEWDKQYDENEARLKQLNYPEYRWLDSWKALQDAKTKALALDTDEAFDKWNEAKASRAIHKGEELIAEIAKETGITIGQEYSVITTDIISDEDFTKGLRDVLLPKLPNTLDGIIGGKGRPVLIKKNIFEKNRDSHPELTPKESREILNLALYHATLAGQSQPKKREHYWVAVNKGDEKNATVVVDVYPLKDNIEVVGWRNIDERGLKKLKRQAEREDGQLLILSPDNGSAAALSALAHNLPLSPPTISNSALDVKEKLSPANIAYAQGLTDAPLDVGDPDIVKTENGTSRFSIASYEQGGREILVNYLKGQVKKKSLTRKDADGILAELDNVYEICKRYADAPELKSFGLWSKAVVEVDDEGNPLFGVVRPNGDYAYNIDFSTVCKKRRPLNRIFAELVNRGIVTDENIDKFLAEDRIPMLQDIIKDHGLEVACALCFVDSKRYKIGEVAKRYSNMHNTLLEMYNNRPKEFKAALKHYHDRKSGRYTEVDKKTNEIKHPKPRFYDRLVYLMATDETARVPVDAGDLISSEGLDNFVKEHPSIFSLYRSFGGVSKAKDAFDDVPYNNDVIRPFAHATNDKKPFARLNVEKVFLAGGVRVQSFSDFVPAMVFDYMQMFAEFAARGLPTHIYTKEASFVKIFGNIGAKINMSLVPAGTSVARNADGSVYHDADGNTVEVVANGLMRDKDGNTLRDANGLPMYDVVDETFPLEEAFRLRVQYGDKGNVGTIFVGVSDEHIWAMLDDDRIDQIIPYHKSSLNAIVAALRGISSYVDYTRYQTTKDPTKAAKKAEGEEMFEEEANKGKVKNDFNFYADLQKTNDPRATANNYLAWCRKHGYTPKFEKFSAHRNYYKLLSDFRLFDNDGNYAPQTAVTAKYHDGVAQDIKAALLEHEDAQTALARETDAIINEFVAATKARDRMEAAKKAKANSRSSFMTVHKVTMKALKSYDLGTIQTRSMIDSLIENRARAEGRDISPNEVKEFYENLGVSLDPFSAQRIAKVTNEKTSSRKMDGGDDDDSEAELADRIVEMIHPGTKGLGLGGKAMRLARSKGINEGVRAAQRIMEEVNQIKRIKREEFEAAKGLRTPEFEAEMGFSITRTMMALNDAYGRASDEERLAIDDRYSKRAAENDERINDHLDLESPIATFAEDEMSVADFSRYLELRKALQEAARKTRDRMEALEEKRKKKREADRLASSSNGLSDEDVLAQMEEEDADLDKEMQEEEDAMLSNFRSILDLNDPNELVWFVQQFCAYKKLGKMEVNATALKQLSHDPIFVRDFAMTLANIAETLANGMVYSRNREQVKQRIADLVTAKSLSTVRTRAIGLFIRIHEARVKESRKEIVANLRKFLKKAIVDGRGALKVAKRDIDRKVTADIEEEARMIRAVLAMGSMAVRRAMVEVENVIHQFDTAKLETEKNMYRDYRRAVKMRNILNIYGGAKHFGVNQLMDLAEETTRRFSGELEAQVRKREEAIAATESRNKALVDALTATRKDALEPGKHSSLRTKAANLLDAHIGLLDLTMDAISRQGATAKDRARAKEILQVLTNHFADAGTKYRAASMRYKEMLAKICIRHYGSEAKMLKRFNTVIDEATAKRISMRYTANADGSVDADSIKQRTRLTVGQVLQLKMSIQQEDYTDNAVRWHRDNDCIEAINSVLIDTDLAWAKDVQHMLNETFAEAQQVYKAITGYTVGTTPNYWPVKVLRSASGLKGEVRLYSDVTNIMTPRVPHALDFDESVSAFNAIYEKLDQQAHMIGYAGHDTAIMDTLCNGDVRRAIRLCLGDKFENKLQNKIQDVLMGPKVGSDGFSRIVAKAGGWFAGCALAFNPISVFRQVAGWAALIDEVGFLGTAKALARSVFDFSDETQQKWRYLRANDAYSARYNAGFTAAMDDVMRGDASATRSFIRKIVFDGGLAPLRWMDMLFARGCTLHVFDAKVKKYLAEGLSTEEARERAATEAWSVVETNQQSSRVENQFESVNRSQWSRLLVAMRSGPLQAMQYGQRAIAGAIRGEEGAYKRLLTHCCATVLMMFIDEIVTQLVAFLKDDDDELFDEEHMQQTIARLAPRLVFGNATALPIVGEAIEMAANRISGAWDSGTIGQPPALSFAVRSAEELCEAIAATFSSDDDVNLAREWFEVVRQMVAPLRLADQIHEGQTGEKFFED